MTARFEGFPQQAFEFFEKLAKNNNRDWFRAHQSVYEQNCREPLKLLVGELAPAGSTPRIMRINRDVRFSRNKSPYRTYIAAGVGGNYVMLSATGLYVGAGIYKPEPAALERLRKAMAADASGKSLERIVARLRREGYEVNSHAKLTSQPRGYSADHPRIELLRMKDIYAGKTFERGPSLSTRRLLDRVKHVVNDLKPLVDWIRVHVGARQ